MYVKSDYYYTEMHREDKESIKVQPQRKIYESFVYYLC